VRHLRLAADGTPGAEAAVTVTPDLDEWDPSMAVRASDGAPFLAFVENLSAAPDGTVYLARVVESEVPAIVAGVVAQAGIASVATDFPFEEVEAQSAGVRGVVPFGTALRAAVESFLADGTDEESPLALVAELTEGPCLQPDPLDRVKCYVDRPTSQLALVRADGTPQAAEHGEEVADAWIFWLYLPELSDHGHWAIVDRAGAAATYNYGFN
jgi:hypothetical protein